MGSSKKTKDRDREKTRDEKKKKKHRSRSRSKEKERHHRHRHKKRSHRKDSAHRSHSPLSEVSDASSDNNAAFASGSVSVTIPPAPRISERSYTPPTSSPPPPPPPPPSHSRGHKRSYEEGDEEKQQAEASQPPTKKGREGGIGGGWEEDSSGPVGGEGGAGASLSIEETNRIRAKLGLKPLQVDATDNASEEEADNTDLAPGERRMKEDSNEFIHKPAQNIREKLQVDKLREKIAAQREKRRLKDKLSAVKTLADSDSEDDALAWVSKNRKLTKERQEAEKKAKQLEELDAQFGIGELVEQEVAKDQRRAYGRNHLSGLKVQHHHSRFAEGSTILTLADSEVLAEGEDTLVNVNFIDQERAERNIERRRDKTDEPSEYEAPEMGEDGQLLTGGLLKKYDEELTGPKQSSFRLGRRGQAVVDEALPTTLGAKEQRLAKLKQLHSLTGSATGQLVNEYMTQDEAAATFRKVKKKKKKKKMLTADDLEPIEDGEVHHGSRRNRVQATAPGTVSEPLEEGQEAPDRIKSLRELMEEEQEQSVAMEVGEDINDNGTVEDDDEEGLNDDFELQEALANARKAQLSKMMQPRVEDIKDMLESNEPSSSAGRVDLSDLMPKGEDEGESGLVVTLNTTDEFCRALGDLPTYGLSGNRAEEEQSALQLQQGRPTAPVSTHAGAWEEVGIEDTRVEISEARPAPILDEEPDASKGVASALKLAIKKGYLEKGELGKKGNAALQHLRAINYSIDDKAGDDDRRGRGGGDRYSGPLTDFREKDGYKPKINLEYVDDEGRKLCPKEAFRYLSHKFHGKGSGKNKTEKRMKKWKEELLMKQMSSSDTPLQTLERQIDKQKALGTSYLVLSGSKNQEPAAATETKIRK